MRDVKRVFVYNEQLEVRNTKITFWINCWFSDDNNQRSDIQDFSSSSSLCLCHTAAWGSRETLQLFDFVGNEICLSSY